MGIEDKELIAEDFTPDSVSLLESNRNLGYSIEEAISDLIDNSITANARNIKYEFHWNEGSPFFLLKDDGTGMSSKNNEFFNSFKLGTKNPREERDPKDLGRFGFGMKTASLSQARCLTVISKKDNEVISRSLDLDFISRIGGGWKLKKVMNHEIINEINYLNQIESGTIIKWTNWDRAPKLKDDFTSLVININNYLCVCFHRFLENGINILCHNTPLTPTSPIPSNSNKYSEKKLSINNSAIQTSYILQHPRHWDEKYDDIERFNSFRLFEGLERQQGIYIYRCDRLLTPKGGWLGVINKGNSAKLARVVIDYPNNADDLWSLDITKTNASIPFEFKSAIKELILASKNESTNKIIRGNRQIQNNLNVSSHAFVWKETKDEYHDSIKYIIDDKHPIFNQLVESGIISIKNLNNILKLIYNNLPVAKIINNHDLNPTKHDRIIQENTLTELEINIAKNMYLAKCTEVSSAAAFDWILNFEPFCYFEEILKQELYGK